LKSALADARESGRIGQLPLVITWQSAVDSTLGAGSVADQLYARLQGPAHRLLLFDVTRQQTLASVSRPGPGALIDRLLQGPRGYTLDLLTLADTQTADLVRRRLKPDGSGSQQATGGRPLGGWGRQNGAVQCKSRRAPCSGWSRPSALACSSKRGAAAATSTLA